MKKLEELKLNNENIIKLNDEWILCYQQKWILIYHTHEDGNRYCVNGKCSYCGKEVPNKISMIGRFKLT